LRCHCPTSQPYSTIFLFNNFFICFSFVYFDMYHDSHFPYAKLFTYECVHPCRGKSDEVFTRTGWRRHSIGGKMITNTSEQPIGTSTNKLHHSLLHEYVIDFPIRIRLYSPAVTYESPYCCAGTEIVRPSCETRPRQGDLSAS
jgi:hypothetical protein